MSSSTVGRPFLSGAEWVAGLAVVLAILTGCSGPGVHQAETSATPAQTPAPAPAQAAEQPTSAIGADVLMIDVQQLTNKALDLANGAESRLSTLSAEEKKAYPIYAVRATYGELSSYAPGLGGDARISPAAPMWALSVHAPVQNDAPAGIPIKKWDVYTVVYDGITGDAVVSSTGIDLETLGAPGDLITAD